MDYHLDTIPVIDALKEDDECLLCVIQQKTDKMYTESFLGGSVTSPETRVQVNEHGFCPYHFRKLYAQKNRLGLALLTHTYMRETVRQLQSKAKKLPLDTKKKFTFSKNGNEFKQFEEFTNWLENKHNECMVCKKVNEAMDRYIYTMLYLFKTSESFRYGIENSKGLCLQHLKRSVQIACDKFGTKGASDWLKCIMPVMYRSFERIDGELDWFEKKFDYRYREEPWGTAEDSLVRALQKMVSDKFE